MVSHVFIPAGSHIALSLEYALSAWKFYPGKGKFFMEEQSISLRRTKFNAIMIYS